MNWYKKASSGYQDGWKDDFGDIQRYTLDPYTCRVYFSETEKKISVSISLNILQMGTVMWQQFWLFKKDEKDAAKKCFEKVKKVAQRVFKEFRTNEAPNTLMYAHLREEVKGIDDEHVAKSNIPQINWSYKIKYEKDARQQIYGNRYPDNSHGF